MSSSKLHLVELMQQAADLETKSALLYKKLNFIGAYSWHQNEVPWYVAFEEDQAHASAVRNWLETNTQSMPEQNWVTLDFENSSLEKQLSELASIERSSIQTYTQICKQSIEKDYKLFDIAYRNMQENIIHLNQISSVFRLNMHAPLSTSLAEGI